MGLFTTGQSIAKVRKGTKNTSRETYERRLDEYKQVLDAYKENLASYEMKLRTFEATEEDHMAAVQVALDLTYIKEELDEIKVNQDESATKREELLQKVIRLDNAIVEPIKRNSFENKNEILNRLDTVLHKMHANHKALKIALGFSLFFNLLSIGGLIFVILYLVDNIWI